MASTNQFDSSMSIYIPRCDTRSLPRRGYGESDEAYEKRIANFISEFIEEQRIGIVSRTDILAKQTTNGFTYYIAFIHLSWRDTPSNRRLQAMINDPKTPAKLYYSPKWFWHVNKNSKPLSEEVAMLYKRVYNKERELLKTNADSEAVYVEILKEFAPYAWNSLHSFASAFPDPDTGIDGAMRDNVRAFIPEHLQAPLHIITESSKSVVESVPQPVEESVPQPLAENVPQPVEESVPQPLAESVPQPLAESVPQPLAESVPQPLAESVPQPPTEDVCQTIAPNVRDARDICNFKHLDDPIEERVVAQYNVGSIHILKKKKKQKKHNKIQKLQTSEEAYPSLSIPELERSVADRIEEDDVHAEQFNLEDELSQMIPAVRALFEA